MRAERSHIICTTMNRFVQERILVTDQHWNIQELIESAEFAYRFRLQGTAIQAKSGYAVIGRAGGGHTPGGQHEHARTGYRFGHRHGAKWSWLRGLCPARE
ncbi:hypothetical protein [Stenotrophomonas indicatrix]|uniref:hypothetical protein n=2 Tax=Stenotrophomonas TaxID=40323 RepID=UPI001AA1B0B3|nr:hypothetical protein [Stenotrophomonas indicatrix]MBO1749924.1 hypothetical protein [Stenotrophomonas indicatrix]